MVCEVKYTHGRVMECGDEIVGGGGGWCICQGVRV